MEKTAKYLRKISAGDIGISAYKVGKEYNVVLGGTSIVQNGGGFGIPGGFGSGFGAVGTIGSFGTLSLAFNQTFYGYNVYSHTKSTYINCLFDENFDHLEGDIPKNKYDILNDFEDTLGENTQAVNIFLHNDTLHYGFFDPTKRVYELYNFHE